MKITKITMMLFLKNNDENEDEVNINFTGNISVIQNCNNTTTKK